LGKCLELAQGLTEKGFSELFSFALTIIWLL